MPWLWLLATPIIGCGVLRGLYTLKCDNKVANVAGFANFSHKTILVLLFIAFFISLLKHYLQTHIFKSGFGFYVHVPLMIGIISYFLVRILITFFENTVTDNLYYIFGKKDRPSDEDCYDEGNKDDTPAALQALYDIFMFLWSILFWPLMTFISFLQSPLAMAFGMSTLNNVILRLVQKVSLIARKIINGGMD